MRRLLQEKARVPQNIDRAQSLNTAARWCACRSPKAEPPAPGNNACGATRTRLDGIARKMTPIFRDGSEGPVADATEANDRYSREHR